MNEGIHRAEFLPEALVMSVSGRIWRAERTFTTYFRAQLTLKLVF
jgi:hypothetical protein